MTDNFLVFTQLLWVKQKNSCKEQLLILVFKEQSRRRRFSTVYLIHE